MSEEKVTQQPLPGEQTRPQIQTHRWIAPPSTPVKRQAAISLATDGATVDDNTVTHVMLSPRRSVPPPPPADGRVGAVSPGRGAAPHAVAPRPAPPIRRAQELPSVQELLSANVRAPQPIGAVTSLDALGMNARRTASGKATMAPVASSLESVTFEPAQRLAPAEAAVTQEFSFNLKDFVAFSEPVLGAAAQPSSSSEPQLPPLVTEHPRAAASTRELRLAPEDELPSAERRAPKSGKRALIWSAAVLVALGCLVGSDYLKGGQRSFVHKLLMMVKAELVSPGAPKAAAQARTRREALPRQAMATASQETVLAPLPGAAQVSVEELAKAGEDSSPVGSAARSGASEATPSKKDEQKQGPEVQKAEEPAPHELAATLDETPKAEATEAAGAADGAGAVRDDLAADATTAAELLANGRVREALSEYRVLATVHPETRVYAEIAKILRRRLINTCKKAQPHRQQECEAL